MLAYFWYVDEFCDGFVNGDNLGLNVTLVGAFEKWEVDSPLKFVDFFS